MSEILEIYLNRLRAQCVKQRCVPLLLLVRPAATTLNAADTQTTTKADAPSLLLCPRRAMPWLGAGAQCRLRGDPRSRRGDGVLNARALGVPRSARLGARSDLNSSIPPCPFASVESGGEKKLLLPRKAPASADSDLRTRGRVA